VRRTLFILRSAYNLIPEEQQFGNPKFSHSHWYIDRGNATPGEV